MRLILALLILGAAPARADTDGVRPFSELYPPMPGVEYFCEDANGQRYEMGALLCIRASCQTWMARCDMSLNNPTWRKVQDGCPAVGLSVPAQSPPAG